ncbi:PilZ domain-containing protein [Photobacterium alginatilyticum]|nr:PilZ domain-containing protein [Photobacterium alginatilyticum]
MNQLNKHLLSTKSREKTISGNQGIAMVRHGSEVTISIKTPLGRLYRIETVFIGSNSSDEIFFELPEVSKSVIDEYFDQGFWLTVKAISEKGEGAIVNFKTQIMYTILKPTRLLVLELPRTMGLLQLRSEPRYDVKLQGKIALAQRELLVDFKDLSKNGCCFYQDINGPQLREDMAIVVMIQNPASGKVFTLTGLVKSVHRSGSQNYYGMLFDLDGQKQAKALLAQLIFDGSKLSFKHYQ